MLFELDKSQAVLATFSPEISGMRNAAALLGAREVAYRPQAGAGHAIAGVVEWGPSPRAEALQFAAARGLPLLSAVPGVLSEGSGEPTDELSSIVVDALNRGAEQALGSPFERSIASNEPSADELSRARRCIARIRRLAARSALPHAPAPMVLVLDQGAADAALGSKSADALERMLDAARSENPRATVAVLAQPNTVRGPLAAAATRRGLRVFQPASSPRAVIAQAERVYTVSSSLGFEALLQGKTVVCFGVPFYAGWGLTDDRVETVPRGARSIEQVFDAVYIRSARYISPGTGKPCEIEEVLDHLLAHQDAEATNRGRIYCFGFGLWKHGFVRAYLRGRDTRVVYSAFALDARLRGFDCEAKALVWGIRDRADVRALASRFGVPIWRMEDGFLRSVGLGSDFNVPASLVVDRQGIYFDPHQPSDLETILQTAEFDEDELARGRRLRETIVRAAISKYNFSSAGLKLERPAGAERVILVPGQVEDDASIRLGCVDIGTNEGLLAEVRRQNPGAHVIFKPHPDLLSGNRKVGVITRERALELADQVITDVPLPMCLNIADEVHTLTSLVGFEAMLRELTVVVYGRPFYAGWGLSRDRHRVERRTRTLTLDMLVAGALIRYPRYLSRTTGRLTTPEVIIAQLQEELATRPQAARLGPWKRRGRKLAQALKSIVDGP